MMTPEDKFRILQDGQYMEHLMRLEAANMPKRWFKLYKFVYRQRSSKAWGTMLQVLGSALVSDSRSDREA